MFIFFFQEDTSRKFLILLLFYFPVFYDICKFTIFARHSLRGTNFTGAFPLNNVLRPFVILTVSLFTQDAFAIIFADCHGLSCVHVRASSYRTLFRVSLGGVGLRCVGLAEKISARCNTGSYVFSFFFT